MGIMGVTGCAMLLCCGFGTFDSIDGLIDKMYGELMTANNKVMLSSEADYGYAYDLCASLKGQMIEETAVELASGDVKKSGSATIVGKGNYMHIQDMKLKPQSASLQRTVPYLFRCRRLERNCRRILKFLTAGKKTDHGSCQY